MGFLMSLEKWQEFVVVVALLAIVFIVCQMTNGASLVAAASASDSSLTCTSLALVEEEDAWHTITLWVFFGKKVVYSNPNLSIFWIGFLNCELIFGKTEDLCLHKKLYFLIPMWVFYGKSEQILEKMLWVQIQL